MNPSLRIEKSHFGFMPDGEEVFEFLLENSHGMKLRLITYGGIIRTLHVPDREGTLEDVVLGFNTLEEYLAGHPYFGSIIGRYGNRIAKGKFSLDGVNYQLATNNLGNHLHGGEVGFDKVNWQAEVQSDEQAVAVVLSHSSEDMEEGFPGTLQVKVTYRLTEENELVIEYHATTDKKTVINLTHHSYFNLATQRADVLEHQLMLNASNYLPVDETLIPLDIASVENTPFDFRSSKEIGRDIAQQHPQLGHGNGYDHCWVLETSSEKLKHAATLVEPGSGRKMEVFTEAPGIQFYTGNFLDGTLPGKEGKAYGPRAGLCLETQHFPDAPNRPDFPSTVLAPGEVFSSKTVYKFTTE